MAISLPECECVVQELQTALPGGWIQKIHQPQPLTLTLDVRRPGETHSLLICVDPRFARLHLISQKLRAPSIPPPFCSFLRSYIDGAQIEAVTQEPGDRIVYCTMRARQTRYILVVALTGRQSNAFLLNEDRMILRSWRPSRQEPGTTYAPPQKSAEAPGSSSVVSPESVPASIMPSLPECTAPSSTEFAQRFPVSARLESRYAEQEQEAVKHRRMSEAVTRIRKAIKQTWKRVAALEADLSKATRYQEYGRYGELLKGSLHLIQPGAESVTVIDYYDPALPELTLPLDPTKDPSGNLADYFRHYQKYVSAEKHVRPRIETAKQEAARLEQELAKLERGDISETMLMMGEEPGLRSSPRPGPGRQPGPSKARGYREFHSREGFPILVGKTAAENDALTFKIAAPDDLWLHARGTPGSHVVVRVPKHQSVPPDTLRDAATLALWYSDLRKSGKGEVMYTKRKYVKKAKGQKPGAVQVSREKSLWVTIDHDRLERLKQGTPQPR